MLRTRHLRAFWLAGLVMLALAHVTHATEHWEIAAHTECLAHAHDDHDHGDSGSRHDHGCSSHDHAPALLGGIFVLTVSETVAAVPPRCLGRSVLRTTSIDHPPQLS